jgi:hypothetical protein
MALALGIYNMRRALLKWVGIDRNADKLPKPPDMCYQDCLEWISLAGTAKIPALGHSSAALTSTAAANLVTIPLAAGAAMGCYIRATTICTDGTDMQAFTEFIEIAAVNKAGSFTSTVTNLSTVGAKAVSGGSTLTTSWAIDSGTAGQITITITATTSLTATSFVCHFEFGMSHAPASAITFA